MSRRPAGPRLDRERAELLAELLHERFYAPRLPPAGGPEVVTLAHLRTQLETYEIRRRLLDEALRPWREAA